MQNLTGHIDKFTERIRSEGLDGIVITGQANRRYLSGFTGSNGVLLIGAETAKLISDFRYKSQAALESPDFDLILLKDNLWKTVGETVQALKWARVGFEAEHLTVAENKRLTESAPSVEWIGVQTWVEKLRSIKEPEEITRIKEAVHLTDQAWNEVWPTFRPGESEKDIVLRLEIAMRRHGADGLAFETIVASGPRGALPHGHAGERQLAEGDLVVCDFGCILNGYHSDMTRTVAIGKVDARQRELYELVLRAQMEAIAEIKPGISGREGDRLARRIIEGAGYGEYFGHSLGHSLGLEIHENPRLSVLEDTILAPGMVLTVEPGIYLPEWGGIRIEDVVVITESGCEILTSSDKNLTIIG